MRHRDGHELWLLDRGKVVARDADGRASRLVGTMSDITAHRQAEQAQREKQAAELASQAKTRVPLAHEPRDAHAAQRGDRLRAAAGHRRRARADGDRRCATTPIIVLDAGQHLLALINDVLDLQPRRAGRIALRLARVSARRHRGAHARAAAPPRRRRGVPFDVQVAPGVLRCVPTSSACARCCSTCGSNAVKYNHPGGSVRWSVEAGAGDTWLARDRGQRPRHVAASRSRGCSSPSTVSAARPRRSRARASGSSSRAA